MSIDPGLDPDLDTAINLFLDYWDSHAREPDELRVSQWVMYTPGCGGDFGCCSEGYDLSDLLDALYSLAGREEMFIRKCTCLATLHVPVRELPPPGAQIEVPCPGADRCIRTWVIARDEDGNLTTKEKR